MNKDKRFLLILVVVIIFSAVMVKLLETDFGSVTIQKVMMPDAP